jgi:ferredoxin
LSEKVRVTVDRDRCVGSGTCVGIAAEFFVMEAGAAAPVADVVMSTEDLVDAVLSCPVEAIRVERVA